MYLEGGEHMYHDASLEQCVEYAKVLKVLDVPSGGGAGGSSSEDSVALKLATFYYQGVKKIIGKRSIVKGLKFHDQLAVLEALPPADGETYSSTKSLHYQLLNDMLTQSPSLVSNWESLDKHQVFKLVERCMEMSRCKDLNNKLRGALLYISTHQYSLEDFHKLFKLLVDGQTQ